MTRVRTSRALIVKQEAASKEEPEGVWGGGACPPPWPSPHLGLVGRAFRLVVQSLPCRAKQTLRHGQGAPGAVGGWSSDSLCRVPVSVGAEQANAGGTGMLATTAPLASACRQKGCCWGGAAKGQMQCGRPGRVTSTRSLPFPT